MGLEIDCIRFWADGIRTLVSMGTESSHRVIMGKILRPLHLLHFACSSLFLQVMRTIINLRWVRNLARSDQGLKN